MILTAEANERINQLTGFFTSELKAEARRQAKARDRREVVEEDVQAACQIIVGVLGGSEQTPAVS